tara:strand:- start:6102 stop:7445 length:1344 start_codon:yes stop_codon:yes gene_type:complete
MLLNNKYLFYLIGAICSVNISLFAEESLNNPKDSLTFSSLRSETSTINQEDYYDFIRISIIEQPEYSFALSSMEEKNMLVKYQQRHRFPDLSFRVINDRSISRDVNDFTSIRKRRDDSFDAAVEINQPIYSGGSINNRVKIARIDYSLSRAERNRIFSELIVDANKIYLDAVKSDFIYSYSSKVLNELFPFLEKVKERVNLGISDPIELAIFSIKYNSLSSKVQRLRTQKNRDIGVFEYFYKRKFENNFFPEILVPKLQHNNKESYEVETARLNYENKEGQVALTKSEFRPQLGINIRYTRYDIDENEIEDNDLRGGLTFSMPIFTFGRASAKISSAKAHANASKMSIGIEKKADEVRENEIVNVIESSQTTRNELIASFQDTKRQRNIIIDRLDVTNFSADALVNSYTEEIALLENILDAEMSLLHGYFLYLHQNKTLINQLGVMP